jgi:hypothetical protein
MGLFGRISNWFNTVGPKVWNAVKAGASTGYNAIHGIAHRVGDLASGIDSMVNHAKSIPLVGAAAEALQSTPLYNEIKQGIKTGVNLVDQVGDAGKAIGNVIDTAIQKNQG